MIENINWYPGHMKKTRELIEENLKLVDLVIEVIDARIPVSSRNPIIDSIIKDKKRIVILNKSDLADPNENKKWIKFFYSKNILSLEMDSNKGFGIKELLKHLEKIEEEKNKDRTTKKPLRMMIVGVPNVGKSSLINRLSGKKSAKTGNKPGVTRGKQWLGLDNGMQLLDTPGILWPKFEDPKVGLNLAFCGSIKDEILDITSLSLELIIYLTKEYPNLLINRYKLDRLGEKTDIEYFEDMDLDELNKQIGIFNMEAICKKRGFILSGNRFDYERCAKTILDEFRESTIGRITLEKIDD